jgi:poly-gamma-glutamate capsule biosynthesis protein CapA/YwtB (metallophosphatase superfamily)
LDLLEEYGVNILATSNNHAWDLGAEGIMSALQELERRNFIYAGSGLNENDAIRPAELVTKHGIKVGLLALVSAPTLNTLGGIATATMPGVNAMQLDPATHLTSILPNMMAAQINAHQEADPNFDILISYHHNHYFATLPGGGGTDETVITDWWRNWAHTAIDNGADIYVSHGSTLLHGVDFYNGKPVLWGLSSTWFQTRKVDGFYSPPNFESVIADICIEQGTGETKAMRFIPVVMTQQGPGVPNTQEWLAGRGVPSVAQNDRGLAILNELKALSAVNIVVDENKYEAYVKFPIEHIERPAMAKPLQETNDLDGERYD